MHAIGSFEELVAAEREVNRGRMPERPFVLVGQQYLADPGRSAGDVHPVWAYAHVPSGYDGDAEAALIDQIERFAPGLRERIVAKSVRSPAEIAAAQRQLRRRRHHHRGQHPVQVADPPAPGPRSLRAPGSRASSSAPRPRPPGAGAHGMNGYNAARSALKHLRIEA